jgi:hypothetical protein
MDERTTQVGIMDLIYKGARRADVWLGQGNQYNSTVAELLMRLAQHFQIEVARLSQPGGPAMQITIPDSGDPGDLRKYNLPSLPIGKCQALIDFFKLRWFERSWVLQEVALAPAVTIRLGDISIPWTIVAMSGAFIGLSNAGLGLIVAPQRDATGLHRNTLEDNVQSVRLLHGMCQRGQKFPFESNPLLLWRLELLQSLTGFAMDKPASHNAAQLLALTLLVAGPFQATDPRDKIFSILPMVNQMSDTSGYTRLSLKPDYQSSTVEIFTSAATSIIEATNHAGILCLVCDEPLRTVKDLPSWVPDWTSQNTPLAVRKPGENRDRKINFDASRYQTLGQLGCKVDGKKLHLKAFKVGTVTMVSEPCNDWWLRGSLEDCAGLLLKCDRVYAPTGQTRIEAFWHTLLLGFTYPHESQEKSFQAWILHMLLVGVEAAAMDRGVDVESYLGSLRNLHALVAADDTGVLPRLRDVCQDIGLIARDNGQTVTYDEDKGRKRVKEIAHDGYQFGTVASFTTLRRRLFLTDEGNLGLGHQSMKEGDSIWIVSSCPSPVVLGPSPTVDESVLIFGGEAYVHGIMFGEAVAEDTKWLDICLV